MDVLGEAAALCSEVLLPLNRVGDSEGCQLVGDSVRTPPGFVEAYTAFAGGGWTGIFAEPGLRRRRPPARRAGGAG